MGQFKNISEDNALTLLELVSEPYSDNDRYELHEVVAEGGMGLIYKAYDCQTDRYVAYKILKRHCAMLQ